jgi:predicted RND superfamily exporter protein
MSTSLPDDYLYKADQLFGRLGLWMYNHKLVVFLAALLLLGAGLYFAATARTDNSFDTFFDATDPAYSAYMTYQDEFGSDEVAYILYSVPRSEHGPFELEAMRRIAQLTEALEYEVPFVKDVTSLSNVEFITADEDFLEIHELALDMPHDQDTLLERRGAMMKKPGYRGSLVNDEATHGAIILEMTVTSSDSMDVLRLDPEGGDGLANLYPQVSNSKILEILKRPEYQGIKFHWSGDVPMNTAYNEVIENEATLLTLLTMVLVSVIALICFRLQLLGLVGPLTVVILGLIMTVGFMGLAGYKVGALFLIAPTLLTAIGVAQSVHLIAEFNLLRSRGLDRREAVKQTLEHVALPCLLAAVTTATGFLVMAGSNLRALAELAIYLGAGVLLTFVASITVMVCYMSMGRDWRPQSIDPWEQGRGVLFHFLRRVADINLKRPVAILLVFGAVLAGCFAGMGRLHVGFSFLEEFKAHTQFRQHTTYVQDVMGGMLNVVFIYDAGEADAVKRYQVLSHMDQLQRFSETSPIVKKTYSVVDILKDMNQSFHGDDPAFYRLPENDELIAQYLLMYEISGGQDLADYLSGDYRRSTLELRVDLTDSRRIRKLVGDLEEYLAENPVAGASIEITGIGMLWIKMAEYIAQSQVWGYGLAFSIIAVILCLAFHSVKMGLLAMIPNLFPVILVLGIMGWYGMHLDYFRLLLATVAIGIAVDDTVHITTRIRKEFLSRGNYAEAIRASLMTVGRPLVITTVILTLSFLVFLASVMEVLSSFGVLLAITMITALLADLFLLPALVMVLRPFGPEQETVEHVAEAQAPNFIT